MRQSPLRHRLAILRTTIGLTQKELAALVGCSTPTIQAVELGKLKLSEGLAERIALQTGIALPWLLGATPDPTPHDSVLEPITPDTFEKTQAELARPQNTPGDMHRVKETFDHAIDLCGMTLLHAYERGQVDLYVFRLLSALKKLAQQHPADEGITDGHMFSLHQKHTTPPQPLRPHDAVRTWYRLFAEAERYHKKSGSNAPSPQKTPARKR
jgi:transcriptional regulator with XRE-family HTH domain